MKSYFIRLIMAVFVFFSNFFKKDKPEQKFHKLNLQFFAGDDDQGQGDDDQEDDTDDDDLNIDRLMQYPSFKKQYQEKFKDQLNKRLKKYKDVDVEEYRRLKEQADQGKKKEDGKEDDPSKTKVDTEKLLRAERKEKRAAVKEFAVDNGFNQKLLARLIDVDQVELDEDGEPVNLDELFEEVQQDFPEYFSNDDPDDDDEEDTKKKKKDNGYKPGSKQKGNNQRKVDPRTRGAERAKQRHKKEE